MRVSRIEFSGFRRLAQTATSIDGRITAFVGFNEAGKTSLLRALDWFSGGDELPAKDRNRSRPPRLDSDPVVKVYFELDDEDTADLSPNSVEKEPTSLVIYKSLDGHEIRDFQPKPRRLQEPFQAADRYLRKASATLASLFAARAEADPGSDGPASWMAVVTDALAQPNEEWSEESFLALEALSNWLSEAPPGQQRAREPKLAKYLNDIRDVVLREHPEDAIWGAVSERIPKFVLFKDEDRALETSYALKPEQRNLAPAVIRLLKLADLDVDAMWSYIQTDDSSQRETTLERANERLRKIFDRTWNQSKVTVRFNVYGTRLEVMIKELRDGGDVTNISERSDGLKTFVALVAFLESGGYTVPPVLLIDEAETHLHYDAQADLVGVLLKSINATQIFYTTHSPGCLPSDLGTGIRVLARDPKNGDASLIRNNFWQGEGPGFSPLLFAMGAGAAAFSVCRNAVLAEGASDMVLLPSLIRQAVGIDDLDYQVAPGLAHAHGSGIRVEEVAARVAYLTDGDPGGEEHGRLLQGVGVDASRIFALPEGHAVEDIILAEDYVNVVNKFLVKMGQSKVFTISDVPPGVPIASAFDRWAKVNEVQRPAKVEIAYALLRADVRLAPAGAQALVDLHAQFSAAFAATHG